MKLSETQKKKSPQFSRKYDLMVTSNCMQLHYFIPMVLLIIYSCYSLFSFGSKTAEDDLKTQLATLEHELAVSHKRLNAYTNFKFPFNLKTPELTIKHKREGISGELLDFI